jgi:hypothetical protein
MLLRSERYLCGVEGKEWIELSRIITRESVCEVDLEEDSVIATVKS